MTARVTSAAAAVAFKAVAPTFEEFMYAWVVYADANTALRSGQAAYLAMFEIREKFAGGTNYWAGGKNRLHDVIVTEKVDPFYDDSNLDDFLRYVKEHWYDYEFSPS